MKAVKEKLSGTKDKLLRIRHRLLIRRFRVFLPSFYGIVLLIGGLLTGLFVYIPSLYRCGVLMGLEFCTPIGTYIVMISSFPGYFIGGNLLKFFPDANLVISALVVVAVSFLFYWIVGVLV